MTNLSKAQREAAKTAKANRAQYLNTNGAARVVRAFIPSNEELYAMKRLRLSFNRWWKVQLRTLWAADTQDETECFLVRAVGLPETAVALLLAMRESGGLAWLNSFDLDKPYTYEQALSDLWTKALSDERTKVETIERVIACIVAGRRNAEDTFRDNPPTDGAELRSWAYISLDSIRCLGDDMLTAPVVAWFKKRGLII